MVGTYHIIGKVPCTLAQTSQRCLKTHLPSGHHHQSGSLPLLPPSPCLDNLTLPYPLLYPPPPFPFSWLPFPIATSTLPPQFSSFLVNNSLLSLNPPLSVPPPPPPISQWPVPFCSPLQSYRPQPLLDPTFPCWKRPWSFTSPLVGSISPFSPLSYAVSKVASPPPL